MFVATIRNVEAGVLKEDNIYVMSLKKQYCKKTGRSGILRS